MGGKAFTANDAEVEAGAAVPADVVTVTSGRPDFAALVAEACAKSPDGGKVGVYTCGPEALADACEAGPDTTRGGAYKKVVIWVS
jgi:hypothetical protein